MFEMIKRLFGKAPKKPARIAWNDEFELLNEKGIHRLENFTGHLSFDERTECDVENATLEIVIGNPGYVEDPGSYHAPWSRGVNQIHWKNGAVTSGRLCTWGFPEGEFNGDTLMVVKDRMRGKFNGKELHENLQF